MRKIRVGILGTGSIVRRIMSDFPLGENYELVAFASRTLHNAQEAKARYGAKYAFGSAEALAACPEVDLVYIATPHNLHKPHTLLMLRAGKHVLCEKPFALNDREAEEMIALAREKRLFLMEAMWSRFMPAMADIKRLTDEGALGEIRLVTANFGYSMAFNPESRIYNRSLAGGALMDVGVYALNLASFWIGSDVMQSFAQCVKAPSGVDSRIAVQLSYENGALAQVNAAVDTLTESRAMVYGSKGFVEIPDFWHATRYELRYPGKVPDLKVFPDENEGHHHEFVHAADCILRGLTESPVMPLNETVKILKTMTESRRACGIVYPEEE